MRCRSQTLDKESFPEGGHGHGKKRRIPFILLILFNLLIFLSVWLSCADAHGLLHEAALTDGTLANTLIVILYYISIALALVPYGCGVLILTIVRYRNARKGAENDRRSALRLLILAAPALVFTLAVKGLFLASIVSMVLYPESFHI